MSCIQCKQQLTEFKGKLMQIPNAVTKHCKSRCCWPPFRTYNSTCQKVSAADQVHTLPQSAEEAVQVSQPSDHQPLCGNQTQEVCLVRVGRQDTKQSTPHCTTTTLRYCSTHTYSRAMDSMKAAGQFRVITKAKQLVKRQACSLSDIHSAAATFKTTQQRLS